MGRWIKRVIGGLLGLIVVLVASGALYQFIGSAVDAQKYLLPGKLVDVGGYRLHLNCTGEGSPTVVMEAGGAAWSIGWSRVQPEIAKLTHACSYDRAGYGWSDPSPTPRTSKQIVSDLHSLLVTAGVTGPYVLVGNSFGGYTIRLYAAEFPKDVAGMVLVDVSHEEQHSPMPPQCWEQQIQQFNASRVLAALGVARVAGGLHLLPEFEQLVGKFPPELQPVARAGYYRTLTYTTMGREFDGYEESSAQVRTATVQLENKPLVVLVAGAYEYPSYCPLGMEQKQQLKQQWIQRQMELAKLSSRGTLRVAETSGHFIQLDQPELVVEAIREVIETVQQR